jgi:uncharacterized protein
MNPHVELCEQLFSAARSEFKHLEYFYFHNCVYEALWRDNRRRFNEHVPTLEVIRQFGPDYKLIIVGDATMSPYEILWAGGSVEHHNQEPGAVWIRRLLDQYPHAAWLNPSPEREWQYASSVTTINQLMNSRMFPLTMEGLTEAIQLLSK